MPVPEDWGLGLLAGLGLGVGAGALDTGAAGALVTAGPEKVEDPVPPVEAAPDELMPVLAWAGVEAVTGAVPAGTADLGATGAGAGGLGEFLRAGTAAVLPMPLILSGATEVGAARDLARTLDPRLSDPTA